MMERLVKEKFKVDSAINGQKAIDMVKKKFVEEPCCPFYKLIIMDLDMPIKDGF